MKKFLSVLGSTIFKIVVLLLMVAGVLCVLFVSPSISSTATISVLGQTAQVTETLAFAILAIFGGEIGYTSTTTTTFNGEALTDPVVLNDTMTLNFDYLALIGIICAVLGVLLFVLFSKNKFAVLVSAILVLASAIFGFLGGTTFGFVNPDIANAVSDLSNVTEVSMISLGGILNGVIMSVTFIFFLIRLALPFEKK